MSRPYLVEEDWQFDATCASCPAWGRKIMTYDAVVGHVKENPTHQVLVVTEGREVYAATNRTHPPTPKGQHGPDFLS